MGDAENDFLWWFNGDFPWVLMGFNGDLIDIPSGNLLHNYGKIHHLFREFCHKKMVMFHSYVTNYQRVVSN